jgi:hypothetical protein
LAQLAAVGGVDHVVGIHPKDPFAASMLQRLVAGNREAVGPGEVENPRAKLAADIGRGIGRAGIDHDHFVNPRLDTFETSPDGRGVVADNHARR